MVIYSYLVDSLDDFQLISENVHFTFQSVLTSHCAHSKASRGRYSALCLKWQMAMELMFILKHRSYKDPTHMAHSGLNLLK